MCLDDRGTALLDNPTGFTPDLRQRVRQVIQDLSVADHDELAGETLTCHHVVGDPLMKEFSD